MEISTAVYLCVSWIVPVAIAWYLVDLFAKRRALAFGGIWLVLLLALIIRMVPAIASGYDPRFNNYDIDSYRIDAQSVLAHIDIYSNPAAEGRHPYLPLQIYFITAAAVGAQLLQISFISAVKVLPILADVGIAGLVYAGALAQWQDREKALRLGLLYALNPVSILIVSYHGQFDSIPVFMSLAAWYVLQSKRRGWALIAAGLLLGLAILDKTWPIIFLPVFFLWNADGWRRLSFLVSVAVPPILGIVAYSLLFSAVPVKVLASSASYGSVWGFWGWTYIVALVAGSVPPTMGLAPLGRLMLLGSLLAFYAFVSRKPNSARLQPPAGEVAGTNVDSFVIDREQRSVGLQTRADVAALLGVVLVLFATTFGFSIQYLMWPLPFALLADKRSWIRWYVGMASLWLAGYYFGWYGLARDLGPFVFWAPVVLWLYIIAWLIAELRTIVVPAVDRFIVLLNLFALCLAVPLLVPGYIFTAYNGQFSTFLLYEFDRVIGDGIFYPRWLPDFTFGYGYPYFDIYSPGAYYAAELLRLIGFDLVSSIKVIFAAALMLSGVTMFGLVKRLAGRSQEAFVAGLAFVGISPFVLQVFRTTAFEASVALAILPLALWGSYESIRAPRGVAIAATAIAFGAMILAHAGLALLCAPVLAIWALVVLVSEWRKGNLRSAGHLVMQLIRGALPFFMALALGLGLAGIFVVPAILDHQLIQPDQSWTEYYGLSRLPDLFQSIVTLSGWAAGQGARTAMPGLLLALPILLALIYIITYVKRSESTPRSYSLYAALVTVAALLMLWSFASLGLWQSVLADAALPWKVLVLVVALAALVAAIAVMRAERSSVLSNSAMAAIVVSALILLGGQLALFGGTELVDEPGSITTGDMINYQRETGAMVSAPVWVKDIPSGSDMADAWAAGLKIRTRVVTTDYAQEVLWVGVLPGGSGMRTNGERIAFTANAEDLTVRLKTFYFPGWHAYLVKPWSTDILEELPIELAEDSGQMQVNVKRGADQWLMFQFQDTPARIAGQWISGISALLVLGLLAWGLGLWSWHADDRPLLRPSA